MTYNNKRARNFRKRKRIKCNKKKYIQSCASTCSSTCVYKRQRGKKKELQSTATGRGRARGVERGHMPPLNPQNFSLVPVDFSWISRFSTLNHSSRDIYIRLAKLFQD